jgi:hypothetical protein
MRLCLTSILGILVFAAGCIKDSDVVGSYFRNTTELRETLEVKADGTFEQDIKYLNGKSYRSNGTWKRRNRAADFSLFYLTVNTYGDPKENLPIKTGGILFGIEKNALTGPENDYVFVKKALN